MPQSYVTGGSQELLYEQTSGQSLERWCVRGCDHADHSRKVPDIEYSQLSTALVALLPRIFAYVISFGVIGVYWLAHHQSLQLIGNLDGFMIWLNLIYLLAVSFIPLLPQANSAF